MHVVLASSAFPEPRAGRYPGIERLVKDLVHHLTAQGIQVTVVTTFWNGGEKHGSYRGVAIHRVRDTSSVLGKWASIGDSHYWTWGLSVARLVGRLREASVVHAISPLAGTAVLVEAGLPVVSTFYHEELLWDWRQLLYKPFHKMLERRAYQSSTLVTCPSKASSRVLQSSYGVPERRVRVTPYGIDLSRFVGDPRQESKTIRVLYVGPHEPRKGLMCLLEAIAVLRGKGIDVHLVTVGKGSQLPDLMLHSRRLGISDITEFRGYLDDPDDTKLPLVYSGADIFVLPSFREGFGFVLVEAMASGLPVIATAISAIPEVVGDAGLLVPPGDPGALAEALRKLILDPAKRVELGRRGRQRVEDVFAWDKAISRILSTYQEAIRLGER